ncbi:MAG TPA: L-aspartate oxidase [Xanthobacteraceae bacterium]|jgi:L-aspartate oxidase
MSTDRRDHDLAASAARAVTENVIIIGGGIAGLFCALKLAPRPVTVLAAAPLGEGASSSWAQGGIAAAVAAGDTVEAHARDTIAAGAGLVDAALAHEMTREAPARIDDLIAYGVAFDRDPQGHLAVGQEAAHSARRIVHVRGDLAGSAIMAALAAAVRRTPGIRVLEGCEAESLLTESGRVVGVRALRRQDQRLLTIPAAAVVLASGGIGHLYQVTTNPPQARGGGLAIAASAGARIADAEFVQFHPTAIAIGRDPAPLASEAIRGEGASLINGTGQRFMAKLHPQAELAPRDVVARGVFAEIAAGRGAYLDAHAAIGASFADRFPTVYQSCLAAGIDPTRAPIPVAPAAHYHMGGVETDRRGRASLEGLWAAGEVAATGVHGANRLASNSLLEGLVFAARVAQDISGLALRQRAPLAAEVAGATGEDAPRVRRRENELRALMSRQVGVVRSSEGLADAIAAIARIERDAGSNAERNMAIAALLIATAAWRRRESRGAHFREDFPNPDPRADHRVSATLADARALPDRAAAPAAPAPVHAC